MILRRLLSCTVIFDVHVFLRELCQFFLMFSLLTFERKFIKYGIYGRKIKNRNGG